MHQFKNFLMMTSKTYRTFPVYKKLPPSFWQLWVSEKSFSCLKFQIGPLTRSCIFITDTYITSSQTTQPRWECEPSCPCHFHTVKRELQHQLPGNCASALYCSPALLETPWMRHKSKWSFYFCKLEEEKRSSMFRKK